LVEIIDPMFQGTAPRLQRLLSANIESMNTPEYAHTFYEIYYKCFPTNPEKMCYNR